MGAGTALVEPLDGRAVVGMAEHGAGREELVQAESPVENVPADQAKFPFQVLGRVDLAAQNQVPEARRPMIHRVDHQVGHLFAMIIPIPAIGQFWRDMLAEQAGDVLPWRGEGVVQGRGDEHFDDGLARPAIAPRVEPGAVHIVQAGPDDDAGSEVVTRFRLAGEAGQVPEGEIHPESTGPATVVVDPFAEILRQVARVYQAGKEEFRIQVGHDRPCGQRGSVFQNDAAGAPFFGQDFTHRGVGPERDASLAAGGSHGLGNGTHSADGMSPGALLAIHLT